MQTTDIETLEVPDNIIDAIMDGAPKGTYQTHLLEGYENWSGASIRGAAKKWDFLYARSRGSVLRSIAEISSTDATTRLVLRTKNGHRRWRRELVLLSGDDHALLWDGIDGAPVVGAW